MHSIREQASERVGPVSLFGRVRGARRRTVVGGLVAAVLVTGTVVAASFAFSAGSSNPGNSVTLGTVSIGDNDSGTALFNASGMHPTGGTANAGTRCIHVNYTGSVPSTVHLYGSTTGALAQYLDLTVTRGSGVTGTGGSCTGFVADVGPALYPTGLLSSYPSNYASGIADASSSWTNGDGGHDYQIHVAVHPGTTGAQMEAQTATVQFIWEAQNQ
jgi:hypothetical protein